MTSAAQSKIADAAGFAASTKVSRETLERLNLYESVLREWQKRINLVAAATLRDVWQRHFLDSAQLMPLIPAGARRLVDLGSGAGFPGLVLAILLDETQPEARVTLIESDRRKGAFLREVARRAGAPVEILSMRIENAETQAKLGPVDVVTARALAPLPRLLGLAAPLFGSETVGLFLKGQSAAAEIVAARAIWSFEAELHPSRTAADASVVIVRRLQRR